MLFTSLNFLVFFCLTILVFYSIPQRGRWILLLVASLIFYLFSVPAYTIVLVGSILLNYLFGLWIDHFENNKRRKQVMIFGIMINLLLIAFLRYAKPLFTILSGIHNPRFDDQLVSKIIVPLGLSFYIFTSISYLIEVKRRRIIVEKHLGYFACYLSFFPKLIQGPIERPYDFIPQLREEHNFSYDVFISGMRLMLWGFFKKLVIADQLSVVVNAVYDDKVNWHGPLLVVATILYAFQIYMDFSGYIDIARGGARMLGFRLSRNFNNPYLSGSIKEFWTRWHITLSQWLRDYIFLPLAYDLSGRMKKEKYAGISTEKYLYSIAITVTFLLCGLWHRVGWNFIVWGGLFAFYLVIGFLIEKPKKRFLRRTGLLSHSQFYHWIEISITFLLVCFAWIFFRASSLENAIRIISQLFSGWDHKSLLMTSRSLRDIVQHRGVTFLEGGIILILIPCIEFFEYSFRKMDFGKKFVNLPKVVRWGTYYLLVLLICYYGRIETNTFIYFQF